RLDLLRYVLDEEEVLRRLRHLLAVQVHEAVLDPEASERLPRRGLRLRDLVLVVREDEILPAAVEIERLAQVLHRHGRALDVPAGTPRSPGARPRRFARLGSLPEREVERIPLRLAHLDPDAGAKVVHLAPRERPVRRIAPHVEVDVPARRVGMPRIDEALDEREDLRDVLGRPRIHGRGLDVEERSVREEGLDVPLRDLLEWHALLVPTLDDAVVDVGEVGGVRDLVAARLEDAPDDVPGHGVAHVSHVRPVLDRHAADVHADLAGPGRLEWDLGAAARVVDPKAHAAPPPDVAAWAWASAGAACCIAAAASPATGVCTRTPAARRLSSAAIRSMRDTARRSSGTVFAWSMIVNWPVPTSSMPRSLGGSRRSGFALGLAANPTSIVSSTWTTRVGSSVRLIGIRTIGVDQLFVRFVTTLISPFGTKWMKPSPSLSSVCLSVSASTVPDTPRVRTTSPTAN